LCAWDTFLPGVNTVGLMGKSILLLCFLNILHVWSSTSQNSVCSISRKIEVSLSAPVLSFSVQGQTFLSSVLQVDNWRAQEACSAHFVPHLGIVMPRYIIFPLLFFYQSYLICFLTLNF
jgi:hypothetical protein